MFLPLPAIADARRGLIPAHVAIALVLGMALLHFLVAGRFDLGVDEAHYALFGRMLDWSYFDHPPMVGWLQALALNLFGDDALSLRLWPVVLTAVAALILFQFTRALFPDASPWTALAAVVLLESAIIFQLISLALVPEGPLLVFGLAAAWFLFQGVREYRLRHWFAVGILFGLAGLSKYTAVLLVITALLFIATQARWDLFRRPGLWFAVLLAAALITPVLWWNARHEWISFAYQLGHGVPARSWEAGRFFRSVAIQLVAYGPGVVLFGALAVFAARKEWRQPGVRFSLLLALPLLGLFGWSAGFEETLPHWTLLGWAALAPLTARWLFIRWGVRWVRWMAYGSLAYAAVLVCAIHAQLISPWMPFSPYRHPLGDLYGWREASVRAAELREGLGQDAVIFVGNWSLASRVAWYSGRPVQVTDERRDQFDLWYDSPRTGARGLLLVPESYLDRPKVSGVARFEQCEEVDVLSKTIGDVPVHTFHFYSCRGYRGKA